MTEDDMMFGIDIDGLPGEQDAASEIAPTEDSGLTGALEGLREESHGGDSVDTPDAATLVTPIPAEAVPVEPIPVEFVPEPAPVPEQDLLWAVESTSVETPAESFGAQAADADPTATAVLPPIAEDIPREMDLGPERRRKWWIWIVVGIVVLAVAGGVAYAWWWTTARPIVVPDVVGKKPAEATQALNDVGLALGKVSEIPTDSAPAGTIISQRPTAKSESRPGATVTFLVASAPEQAKTPNVVGVSTDDAARALAEARLRPFIVESYSTTVPAGFVIGQVPLSGYELPPGTVVALAVSKGMAPASTTVPHSLGLPEADGLTLLQARKLVVRVYRSRDASIAAGLIIGQSPLPGSAVAPDSVVQILVSTGPSAASATVPNVVGSTRKVAEASLKKRNLTAEVVNVSNATIPKGNVISQMPPAGKRVGSGAVVGLLVSTGPATQGVVPSLVGTLSIDTSKTIGSAGFRAVMVTIPVAGEVPGRVFGQFPLPGTGYPRSYPVICLIAESIKP